MRISHIIHGLPKAAGTSVFCAEIAREQALLGHDVCVAVVNALEDDAYPLAPCVRLTTVEALVAIGGLCPGSVVHIHGLWSPGLRRAASLSRKCHCAIVWSPHGMLTPWAMRNKRWKKLLGWHLYQKHDLQLADLLHVTSQSEVDDVRRLGLKNRLVVAPLGVVLPRLREPVLPQTRSDGRRTLLFVSRVQKKKGLPNLLSAWALLDPKERAGWRIRIVGPDQEGHEAELGSMAASLGISDAVEFSGPLFGADLSSAYDDADLFVLPTHSENFGSVIIEAMAHGLPVITTKGTPWHEIESERCGKWVDVGVEPLVGALNEMMSISDAQRTEMGARGRALVNRKYTWRSAAEAMLKGYEEVLRGRS